MVYFYIEMYIVCTTNTISSPKNENSFIYSPPCCSKPEWLTFFCVTQKKIFWGIITKLIDLISVECKSGTYIIIIFDALMKLCLGIWNFYFYLFLSSWKITHKIRWSRCFFSVRERESPTELVVSYCHHSYLWIFNCLCSPLWYQWLQ